MNSKINKCLSLSAGEQQHPGPSVSVTVRPDHTDITCIITCISCVNFHPKLGDADLMVHTWLMHQVFHR